VVGSPQKIMRIFDCIYLRTDRNRYVGVAPQEVSVHNIGIYRHVMANTEGLSDEAVSSLLTLPPSSQPAGRMTSSSRLARREKMMELSEGETPAATVIRASKAPTVVRSGSTKKSPGRSRVAKIDTMDQCLSNDEVPMVEDRHNEIDDENHKPVIMSAYIHERSVCATELNGNVESTKPRVSRFKQRNNELRAPTAGGFPSLDNAPVGTFTRKGMTGRTSSRVEPLPRTIDAVQKSTQHHHPNAFNNLGQASDSLLASMSTEEIREGVEEITTILSSKSIDFLKRRGKQKLATSNESSFRRAMQDNNSTNNDIVMTRVDSIQLEERMVREGKEKTSELLSSVRTPDDMDRVYNEALELGLAAELPSSSLETIPDLTYGGSFVSDRIKNLHIATSLLRSTVPKQRLLGAKRVCEILEEDVTELVVRRREHSYSDSYDKRESLRETYPQFLPVAVRCLLDESLATFQTTGGRILLSTIIRCIHSLMILFVHPYHVITISPETHGCDDPFILYQTCFMSDVSHCPPGTELYPPTQIRPLDEVGDDNAACYRTDSSAATAASDSKAFYNDPAWTLLSRMRVLPCLSDVLRCVSTESVISEATIRSICGILAMLSVRSPGAAGAIACHKGILPFLISYCLSPQISFHGEGLFKTANVQPALILLCTLARQSRDIAELEIPFQMIIPELQAILCVEAESEIQCWSVILLRILMRYSAGIEHVETLISMSAPCIEMMRRDSNLITQYLSLFAAICYVSKTDDRLAMSGSWLSFSVTKCITSFQDVVKGGSKNDARLASAQLQFIASYISTAAPTKRSHYIPIVSNESCSDVIKAALESEMLNNALAIVLRVSFNATWDACDDVPTLSLEDEAIGCAFVSSLMTFVEVLGNLDLSEEIRMKLVIKMSAVLEYFARMNNSTIASTGSTFHPARQSWLVESEFSVLNILCKESSRVASIWPLLSTFAFSLLGRLNMGHEKMADFICRQQILFQVGHEIEQTDFSLQTLFLTELSIEDRRKQLDHSANIYFMSDLNGRNKGPLISLRCFADVSDSPRNDVGVGRFFLPLGGIWMWNVLSSTVTSQEPTVDQNDVSVDVVSHTLRLLLQLEMMKNASHYAASISNGTKLYHTTNVCLFPEIVLSDDTIKSSLDLLFQRLTGFKCSTITDKTLVNAFIKACFGHSRISKESKKSITMGDVTGQTAQKLHDMLNDKQSIMSDEYSKDELKALDDFVEDLCNAFIEYGGQHSTFTNFIRLFLRHDFPSKVISTVLTKLYPVLNLLTIEEEDRDAQLYYLTQSIRGGLPSQDSSRRDTSIVLDSFSYSLRKRDKVLSRHDYAYLLAVAYLSRNLASSSQRCECGLEATKNRLAGLNDEIVYDITQVGVKILADGSTADAIINCVLDVCLDSTKGLLAQDENTQKNWRSMIKVPFGI